MKLGIEENVVGCPEETTVAQNTKEFVETLLAIERNAQLNQAVEFVGKSLRDKFVEMEFVEQNLAEGFVKPNQVEEFVDKFLIPIESVTEDHDKSVHGYLAEMFVVMFPTQNMYVEMLQDIEMKVFHVKDPLKYPTM